MEELLKLETWLNENGYVFTRTDETKGEKKEKEINCIDCIYCTMRGGHAYCFVKGDEIAYYGGCDQFEQEVDYDDDDADDADEKINQIIKQYSPDPVNHPAHYETGRFECIDVMLETQGAEAVKGFCLCNAFKYLYRHNNKNGDEDIKKAIWYLNKYLELSETKE